MNLYRLDYESPDGQLEPVTERAAGRAAWQDRDYLSPSYAVTRQLALDVANATGAVVRITRISGGGRLRAIARASGETHRIHRFK